MQIFLERAGADVETPECLGLHIAYLVLGQNDCVSVFSDDAPTIVRRDED